MATSPLGTPPNYSRWQAAARGAGYGRNNAEDARLAQYAKQQTDEKDFSNLDATISHLDEYTVQIQDDWKVYNDSLTDTQVRRGSKSPTLPEGFTGTAKEYEEKYFKARDNASKHKTVLPSDIEGIYGKQKSIQFENLSGLWGTILGDGKFMNSVTSQAAEGEFGPGVDYQVSTVDPETGKIHDANPTFGGKSEAALAAEGGDEAVAAGSWPTIPNEVRDKAFLSNIRGVYQRVPGASSAVRTLNKVDPELQGYVPGRVANEQAVMEEIAGASEGKYDAAFADLQKTQAAYNLQESDIDADFAKSKQERRTALEQQNKAIQEENKAAEAEAESARLTEAATAAAANRSPEGTGYGGTWSRLDVVEGGGGVSGSGPRIIPPGESLPMGDELYRQLPQYYTVATGYGGAPSNISIKVPEELKDFIVSKDHTPLNMDTTQHKSLSYKQRKNAEHRNEAVIQKNLQTLWRDQVTLDLGDRQSTLRTELKEYREASVPEDISAADYDTVADEVEAFYKKHRRGANKEAFWKELRNDPDDLALFRESPFKFAEKYMNDENGFIGVMATPEEVEEAGLPKIKELVDIDAVIEAMERPSGTLMPSDMEALKVEVDKLGAIRDADQQKVVKFISQHQEKKTQLKKEDWAATWLAVASTFPEGDARGNSFFKSIAQAGPSLIERGSWDDFSATYQQNNRRLDQQDSLIGFQGDRIDLDKERLDLDERKLTFEGKKLDLKEREFLQGTFEFNTGLQADKYKNNLAWGAGTPSLQPYKTRLTGTQYYKMLYNTDGKEGGYDPEDFNIEDFAGYTKLGLEMLENIYQSEFAKGPMETWGPAEKANYLAVQSDLAIGTKMMLRKMSLDNKSWWNSFLSLFGADYEIGTQAFDLHTSLIAFDVTTNQPTEDPKKIGYYKHVDPRTMQEDGNKIPATDMDRIFGSLGGREMLLALSLPNHMKYRNMRGIK